MSKLGVTLGFFLSSFCSEKYTNLALRGALGDKCQKWKFSFINGKWNIYFIDAKLWKVLIKVHKVEASIIDAKIEIHSRCQVKGLDN